MEHIKEYREFINENLIIEGYEVFYSDGINASRKFKTEGGAVVFMKDIIKSNKKLQHAAVYKTGSGFHSTADISAVVAFWGDGSYLDNVSKRDKNLASKKINESHSINENRRGMIMNGVQQALKANGLNLKQSDFKLGIKKTGMGYEVTLNGQFLGYDDNMAEMVAKFTKYIEENPSSFGLT